jgi:hypothetical protein
MSPTMDAAGGAPAARVSAATIKGFAESLGVPNLPDDVAAAQAADVEYRLRQIIQASSAAGAPARGTPLPPLGAVTSAPWDLGAARALLGADECERARCAAHGVVLRRRG